MSSSSAVLFLAPLAAQLVCTGLYLAAVTTAFLLSRNQVTTARPKQPARPTQRDGRWWHQIVPMMGDEQFHENFRMSRDHARYLSRLVLPVWERRPAHLANVDEELAVCLLLHRLGTTASCREIGNQFGLCRSWVCDVTGAMAEAVSAQLSHLIRTPESAAEWEEIALRWNQAPGMKLLNVCGAIDGTHIPIWKPSIPNHIAYINRHKYHSYNIQAVVNDRGLFMNVVCGLPGAAHDAGVLSRSGFSRHAAATVPRHHFILGDSGYPLLPWLLTPYKDMHRNAPLSREARAYNTAHASTRSVVERAFGTLKSRWRKLQKMDMRKQQTVHALIRSAFVLHNFVEMLEHAGEWPDVNIVFESWPEQAARAYPPVQAMTEAKRDEVERERNGLAALVLARA